MTRTPISHPSPWIRVCTPVCAEAVRVAVCAAVSSLRKLSSGGYCCHDHASIRVRLLGAYHSPHWESRPERRDPECDGVLDGKTQLGGWVVASSPGFYAGY